MRKRRSRKKSDHPMRPRSNRQIVVAICVAVSLTLAGAAMAHRDSLFSASTAGAGANAAPKPTESNAPPTTAPQAQLSLAKEYVYAGGRLLATEEPPGSSCGSSILPTTTSFTSQAGTGSVTVTIPTGCAWTAASNAGWITITSGASGTGSGTVNYSVGQNTSASQRTGTITIAAQTFTVTQSGTGCASFSITPTSASHPASQSSGSASVTAEPGCSWTASSNDAWLTISSGATGTGSGSVSYAVAQNPSASERTGTMTIAGQIFTVTQAGSGCTYSINPTSQTLTSAATTGSTNLTTTAGCAWTAQSNASWITLNAPTSGTGSGTVSYTVTQNTSSNSRTGTITIAALTFTVTQTGVCTYSINPTSQTAPESGIEFGQIVVSAGAGCPWTASSSQSWISVNPVFGAGESLVFYSVASNAGPQRTGQITIAGEGFSQNFTITQNPVTNGASFVSQTVPTSLYPGQGQSVSVTMTNIGSAAWSPGTYVLRSQNPAGNTTWGMSEIALPTSVASGSQVTFTFTITSPTTEAVYNFQWQMYKVGGAYFGDLTPNLQITVSGSATVPPPSNLTATASGSNINLNWQNNIASNYIAIERKIGSGSWSQIATVGSTATSYTNLSLAAGTYTYRVRCFVGNGTASPYSNEASAAIGGSAPSPPTDLAASLLGPQQVNLSWTDTSTNETGFRIERKTGAGSYSVLTAVGVNITSFLDTSVVASTTYTYRVKALNGTLESDFSNESSVTTGPPPPPLAAPTDLSATVVSISRVDLAWLDNSNNEDGFKLERKTGAGSFTVIATLGVNTVSFSDTVAASTQYTYQVRAFSTAGGDSSPSNSVTVTTPAPPPPPADPGDLVATAVSSSQINLTWSDHSNNEDGFKIERDSGAGFSEIVSVSANVTSFSNTGLSPSTQYTYRVRAYAGSLFSLYTAPASATTQASGGGGPCPLVSTLSGDGVSGYVEGTATSARWNSPAGGVVGKDPATGVNALFISDTNNHRIRKIYLEGASVGQSDLVGGSGVAGYSDGAGVAKNARFNFPRGITALVNGSGTVTALFVADTGNHMIRKLAWSGSSWTPSRLAGSTVAGAVDSTSGPNAKFNAPQGITLAPDGYLYVADTGNGRIRKVDQLGATSTLVGAGTFTSPVGITTSSTSGGLLYVSDWSTHKIYQMTVGGVVTLIAGSGIAGFADGTGTAAIFNSPAHLVWANPASGAVLYIADQSNNRIRRLVLSTNAVNTHAGSGTAGFAEGSCGIAQFNAPRGVAFFSSTETLYVIDTSNNRIRKLQ